MPVLNPIIRPPQVQMLAWIGSILKNKNIHRVCIAVLFFIAVFAMVAVHVSPRRYDLRVGDVAPETIKAPKDAVDVAATEAKKQEAMDAVPNIYQQDDTITEDILAQLDLTFDTIGRARDEYKKQQAASQNNVNKPNGSDKTQAKPQQDYEIMFTVSPVKLSAEDIKTVIEASDADITQLKNNIRRMMARLLADGIKADSIDNVRNQIMQGLQDIKVPNEVRTLGFNIAVSLIKPNMIYDEEATDQQRNKAAEAVEKVMIKKGQAIVQKDTVVTKQQFEQLRELGMLKSDRMDINVYIGMALLIGLLETILALYIFWFEKDYMDNTRQLLMIACIMIFTIFMAMLIAQINIYLVPITLGAMLSAVLLRPHMALMINIVVSLLVLMMMDNNMTFALLSIISGSAAVYVTMHMHQRNGLLWTGLLSGIAGMITIVALDVVSNNDAVSIAVNGLWTLGGGLFAGVLAIGTLPVWENVFDVVTPIKLLELSNPNQPLLKQLLLEAPGTYHHSIIVGNLSESAAQVVGANELIARVGAYYHDIGKLKRPYFFIENQVTPKNPHDKLKPSMSALIITSHTKDGLELAAKHHLPRVIQDIICQHHGTTLVSYFYHKAKEGNEGGGTDDAVYRYSGPKPQTREAAIIMMADSVEAAVRSLPEPTKGKIDGLVRKIIKDKLDDGQLDQCALTFKDLSCIAEAFSSVLCGIFHERIEYPKDDADKIMEEHL